MKWPTATCSTRPSRSPARSARRRPHPRVRDRRIVHENAAGFIQFARNSAKAAAPNFPAPHKCIDAIEAGVLHGFDKGQRCRARGFRRADDDAGKPRAAARVLRRACREQDSRRAGRYAAARDPPRRRDRRGHDGRRDRDELRQRGAARHAARDETGCARARRRDDPQELRRAGEEGQARREARRAHGADHADAVL